MKSELYPVKLLLTLGKYIIIPLLVFSFQSCNKGKDVVADSTTTQNGNFKSIVASENFNWDTHKQITLEVTPLATSNTETFTLIVKTTDNQILYSHAMQMSEALSQNISVPADAQQLEISYGAITKQIDIVEDIAKFDFLTPIPAAYQ